MVERRSCGSGSSFHISILHINLYCHSEFPYCNLLLLFLAYSLNYCMSVNNDNKSSHMCRYIQVYGTAESREWQFKGGERGGGWRYGLSPIGPVLRNPAQESGNGIFFLFFFIMPALCLVSETTCLPLLLSVAFHRFTYQYHSHQVHLTLLPLYGSIHTHYTHINVQRQHSKYYFLIAN